jgi:hypothetical protein
LPALISGAALILVNVTGSLAAAQQTLFNVPSSDTLERGKVYAELDASFKPIDPKFSSFVPRVVVGVGRRVEVGLNISGNIQPGPDATTLIPAIKWRAYDGGDNGWALVIGEDFFVPVRNRSYSAGNYTYAQLSKTFDGRTRVTAGGYYFSSGVVANAQRAGGQFGFEHIVNTRLTLAADWFNGKHALGYLTPGIIFKVHPKATGYFGYSIGNGGVTLGNHFFLFEFGVNVN